MAIQHDPVRSVDDAINVLNRALKNSKHDGGNHLGNGHSFVEALKSAVSERLPDMDNVKESARQAVKAGQEKVKAAAGKIDESVHEEPWKYLGGAALIALVLGFVAGRSGRR